MLGYLSLFLLSVFVFIGAYRLSGYELFSPAPLAAIGFSVSLLLSIVGTTRWNSFELSNTTLIIVSLGIISFLIGAVISKQIRFSNKITAPFPKNEKLTKEDNVHIWKYILLVVLVCIAIGIRLRETIEIASLMGLDTSNYANIASIVRQSSETFISAEAMRFGSGYSFIERQFEKIVWACGFVGSFLAASAVSSKSIKRVIPAVILMLSTWVFYIIAGGRGTIMYQIIAFFTIYSIQQYRKQPSEVKRVSNQVLLVGCVVAVICAAGMYFAGALVGRPANDDIIGYVSFYFGGSTPSLEILNETGWPNIGSRGVMTFYNLLSPLYKFNLIDSFPNYSIAWVDAGGNNSNIFTCFARYYLDFGYVGVFVLGALSIVVLSLVYLGARRTGNPFIIIVAGYFSPFIFDMAREEFVFSRMLALSQVFSLVVILAVAAFMILDVRKAIARIGLKMTKQN